MVESEAKELPEEVMLGAVMFGHRAFPAGDRGDHRTGREGRQGAARAGAARQCRAGKGDARPASSRICAPPMRSPTRWLRHDAVDAAKAKVMAHFFPEGGESRHTSKQRVGGVFKDLEAKIVRWNILDTGKRIDGRDVKTVRPIVAEVGVLPRAHGSALFTRGETQALVVATLGTGEDEQFIDALKGTYKEHFMLHYNFPPFSVGETGRMGSPGRREIGHGKLAWRAVHPMLPPNHEFPYTLRVVSEITESNGSSSMATVCGASLALMDAGVPLTRADRGHRHGPDPGGPALRGAVRHPRRRGPSRRHGLQGRRHARGVTSLQMDIKIAGITEEIMRVALGQASEGRLHILGEMSKALGKARAQLGEHAPRIEVLKIPTDKIREVIGTGGKVIREIVEKTGAKVDISDDGTVKIASSVGRFHQGGAQLDQVDRLRSGGRPDLRWHRRQGDGLRRLRELLRFARRPRPHQPAVVKTGAEDLRRRQGRRKGQGQAAWASTSAARCGCRCGWSTSRPAKISRPSRRPKPRASARWPPGSRRSIGCRKPNMPKLGSRMSSRNRARPDHLDYQGQSSVMMIIVAGEARRR